MRIWLKIDLSKQTVNQYKSKFKIRHGFLKFQLAGHRPESIHGGAAGGLPGGGRRRGGIKETTRSLLGGSPVLEPW